MHFETIIYYAFIHAFTGRILRPKGGAAVQG